MSALISKKYVLAGSLWLVGLTLVMALATTVSLIIWGQADSGYISVVVAGYMPLLVVFAGIAHFEHKKVRLHETCIGYVTAWLAASVILMALQTFGGLSSRIGWGSVTASGRVAGALAALIAHAFALLIFVTHILSDDE